MNYSLNPCFVGMWSFSAALAQHKLPEGMVLILVLLGCGLLVNGIGFDDGEEMS